VPRLRLIFERQWIHALFLMVSFFLLVEVSGFERVHAGQVWGVDTTVWFWIAVGIAVAHQSLVWFCWRTQLHGSLLTRTLGKWGFRVYAVAFSILGIARAVAVFLVAESNRDTLDVPTICLRLLALILALPTAYLFYSVKRYFGFKRALGLDHFDETYRSRPMVRKGIFRFTSNGMYVFGFLILWIPGLWYASMAALWVALFSHLYIWVHYFSTELPDMKRIYGGAAYVTADRRPPGD
jgi:hypothetical protein